MNAYLTFLQAISALLPEADRIDAAAGIDHLPHAARAGINELLSRAHEMLADTRDTSTAFPFDSEWPAEFWISLLEYLVRCETTDLSYRIRRTLALRIFKRIKPHVLRRRTVWQGICYSLYYEADPDAWAATIRLRAGSKYPGLFTGSRLERGNEAVKLLWRFHAEWAETAADPFEPM